MNIPITVADDVRDDIACCVAGWINKAAAWSQARYDFLDLEKDVVIAIEQLPEDISGEWATFKPQKRPYEIRISEIDHVWWAVEAQKEYWLRSSYFYVGPELAYEVVTVALLTGTAYTLGPDDHRAKFDRLWTPEREKYAYLSENYPQLITDWTDRSGWLDDHVSKIPHTHWSFPPTPKGLCRLSGASGPGSVWPEGCER
jgi:hypothetical protein